MTAAVGRSGKALHFHVLAGETNTGPSWLREGNTLGSDCFPSVPPNRMMTIPKAPRPPSGRSASAGRGNRSALAILQGWTVSVPADWRCDDHADVGRAARRLHARSMHSTPTGICRFHTPAAVRRLQISAMASARICHSDNDRAAQSVPAYKIC